MRTTRICRQGVIVSNATFVANVEFFTRNGKAHLAWLPVIASSPLCKLASASIKVGNPVIHCAMQREELRYGWSILSAIPVWIFPPQSLDGYKSARNATSRAVHPRDAARKRLDRVLTPCRQCHSSIYRRRDARLIPAFENIFAPMHQLWQDFRTRNLCWSKITNCRG